MTFCQTLQLLILCVWWESVAINTSTSWILSNQKYLSFSFIHFTRTKYSNTHQCQTLLSFYFRVDFKEVGSKKSRQLWKNFYPNNLRRLISNIGGLLTLVLLVKMTFKYSFSFDYQTLSWIVLTNISILFIFFLNCWHFLRQHKLIFYLLLIFLKSCGRLEQAIIDLIIDEGPKQAGQLPKPALLSLYQKNLIYFDIPIKDSDVLISTSLCFEKRLLIHIFEWLVKSNSLVILLSDR